MKFRCWEQNKGIEPEEFNVDAATPGDAILTFCESSVDIASTTNKGKIIDVNVRDESGKVHLFSVKVKWFFAARKRSDDAWDVISE